ncbi:hypothetical protein SAMN05216553_114211 [Lentzea fradiae]|uniref:Uncharacterized protein n=1 Tax=Lentzea fradiae TaxID=200378 RepID=A0A1G7YXK4_9PSEU|nr:hypothetical protein [Lentzea fradiae]SDH01243.1 hypothetical protein SAMN05216553_114211 [Lentzea fradiae]
MKKTTALVAALLLALTACGNQPAGNEQKQDDTADMVKFAQCMRENGIDMPDPGSGGEDIALAVPGGDADGEKVEAAHEACKQHLPNGGEFKPPSPEEQDKMREQAKCMRDKGYNWPDPNFDGGGAGEPIELPDLADEKVKQDMKDCGLGEGMMVSGSTG